MIGISMAAATGIWGMIVIITSVRVYRNAPICPQCGYDMRQHSMLDRCPECAWKPRSEHEDRVYIERRPTRMWFGMLLLFLAGLMLALTIGVV